MNKKQAKRRRDIKTKLMAAICMLLVSSIMMVSTTYAWFTLSTAPEVTGINTAVGANGNLEMALIPEDGDVTKITSAVGDSVKDIKERNTTWGNLVDLSDSSIYGLDGITLYPAAINHTNQNDTDAVTAISKILLKTPQYGSDGRVAQLAANTSTGIFDVTEKDFFPNDLKYGVRGVGTASGMTQRQLTYRNALSTANTATASAKNTASQSLNNNGSTLANVVIKKATSDDPTFNQADVNALMAIVNDLLGVHTQTENKTGALEYIDQAYMNYILAYTASAAAGEGEAAEQAYVQIETAMEADNATASSVLAALNNLATGIDTSALTTAIGKLEATKTAVTTAKGELEALTGDSITWGELSVPLSRLADTQNMEVNGIKASEIKGTNANGESNMQVLVNAVASGGLKVTMKSAGGVYADIADHCGDYTAQVVIQEVTYNGLTLKNTPARMETVSNLRPDYFLTAANTAVTTAGAPASSADADMPITDMYGYVIDMAFRTNAAESNLLLQQEAVDRIYGDNSNDATMGHGSNMTFNITAGGITVAQLRDLMNAIRIVFFVPGTDSNTVKMAAKLDVPADDAGMTAKLTADGYKVNLVLGTIDGKGGFTPSTGDANVLMPLTQNTVHQLSVLVYLDGNLVGNDDVAAQAATSMTGKLNLQFASSATLVPMDYSQLHTPKTAADGTTNDNTGTTTSYTVSVPEGVTGATTAATGSDYTFTVADGYTLGTVTVGDQTVTPTAGENGAYTIPAASVTGNIVINVTANNGG